MTRVQALTVGTFYVSYCCTRPRSRWKGGLAVGAARWPRLIDTAGGGLRHRRVTDRCLSEFGGAVIYEFVATHAQIPKRQEATGRGGMTTRTDRGGLDNIVLNSLEQFNMPDVSQLNCTLRRSPLNYCLK